MARRKLLRDAYATLGVEPWRKYYGEIRFDTIVPNYSFVSDEQILAEARDPATSSLLLQSIFCYVTFLPHGMQPKWAPVQQALAGNPSSPPRVLIDYIDDFPMTVLRNPALPLILLENPNFFIELPRHALNVLGAVKLFPALRPFIGEPREDHQFQEGIKTQHGYAITRLQRWESGMVSVIVSKRQKSQQRGCKGKTKQVRRLFPKESDLMEQLSYDLFKRVDETLRNWTYLVSLGYASDKGYYAATPPLSAS